MYVSTTPEGETEGVLAFVVPVGQCCTALNSVHHKEPSGPAEDLGSRSGEILVAHDGRRLPSTSERMPTLSSIRGRST